MNFSAIRRFWRTDKEAHRRKEVQVDDKQKVRKARGARQAQPLEAGRDDDARAPLADTSSDLPTRSTSGEEGMPGEAGPVHGSGYQQPADAVHPNFGSAPGDVEPSEDEIRRRAYQLWEEEGFPEGSHDRHWLEAEQELRARRT